MKFEDLVSGKVKISGVSDHPARRPPVFNRRKTARPAPETDRSKKRLVLVDGMNFFYRGAWVRTDATSADGGDVSMVLEFMRNLSGLMRELSDMSLRVVVCWDGGYDNRLRISSEAVDKGLIPKTYKQERREARETTDPEELAKEESFRRQLEMSRALLRHTVVGQAMVAGSEADDVIGSYAARYSTVFDDIVLVTTDRDYYQLLDEHTRIYNSGKRTFFELVDLRIQYRLQRGEQWIDVGALAGESGPSSDTIYGVKGIGYKTASKLIYKHGTLDNLIDSTKRHFKGRLETMTPEEILVSPGSRRTEVAQFRQELRVLACEDVVRLARRLKEIDRGLQVWMPEIEPSYYEFMKDCGDAGISLGDAMCGDLTDESMLVPDTWSSPPPPIGENEKSQEQFLF